MAFIVRFLEALFVLLAIGGPAAGLYTFYRYPWHEVNRASRVPVRGTTIEISRRCLSAGFLLFAPISVGALLSFTATMTKLRATVSETTPEHTLVQRVALSLPWDLVATGSFALAALLVFVPLALIAIDLALGLLGWLDPSTDG